MFLSDFQILVCNVILLVAVWFNSRLYIKDMYEIGVKSRLVHELFGLNDACIILMV